MASYGDWELAVHDVAGKMDRGELIPDPEWQRGYIWKLKDEQLLIDSIVRQMPIPKFYLTQEYDPRKGVSIHYAVDGQQRLKAIWKFLANKFSIDQNGRDYYFKDLDSETQEKVTTYKLNGHYMRDYTQVDINFLFQRLNRTGIKLTNMEEWNNEYYGTNILGLIKEIEKENKGFFEDIIYTEENVKRLLPLDDIVDLCHCLTNGRVESGRKSDLQEFLKQRKDIAASVQTSMKKRFRIVFRNLQQILSKQELESSQYGKRTHFISLFLAVALLVPEYYVLANPQQLESDLLNFIENQPAKYKESVLGAIRDKVKRDQRVTLLQRIVKRHAKKLDSKRSFPEDVKQKLWRQGNHKCQICMKQISGYEYAAIDHVQPWAKGGRTVAGNAQLAHRRCNQRKRDKVEDSI